jgi:hypothetical protein
MFFKVSLDLTVYSLGSSFFSSLSSSFFFSEQHDNTLAQGSESY